MRHFHSSALLSLAFHAVGINRLFHQIYPTMEKAGRKRLALLINNIEFDRADMLRSGAEKDGKHMEALLRDLDYDVVHLKNKSAEVNVQHGSNHV